MTILKTVSSVIMCFKSEVHRLDSWIPLTVDFKIGKKDQNSDHGL